MTTKPNDDAALSAALSVPAAAVVGEPGPMQHVRAHAHLVRCFAEEMTARNWADKALYIKQQADFIISAVDAAPSAPEGWRPIDSAPKDGTRFLASVLNDVTVLHWHGGQKKGCWHDENSAFGYGENLPTHWRPLPVPPALGGKP